MGKPAADTIVTPDTLPELTVDLYETRQKMKDLETREKAIMAKFRPMVSDQIDACIEPGASEKLTVAGYTITRSPTTHRSISRDRLLERGVAPDIIAYATNTSESFRFVVAPLKIEFTKLAEENDAP